MFFPAQTMAATTTTNEVYHGQVNSDGNIESPKLSYRFVSRRSFMFEIAIFQSNAKKRYISLF